MASKTSSARSHQAKPAHPRVIPAIPHALNSRSKAPQPRSQHEPHLSSEIPPPVQSGEQATPPSSITAQQAKPQDASSDGQELTNPTEIREVDATAHDINLGIESPREASEPTSNAQQDENSQTPAASHPKPNVDSQTPVRELPPPFIPKNTSFAASTVAQQEPKPNSTNAHQPRLSTNSLVFGGMQDSASSSPAPPSGGGQVQFSPQAPMGYPVPMQMQGPPNFVPGGHAYHLSDPYSNPFYPPHFYQNPNFQNYTREHYGPPPPQLGQSRPFYPSNHRMNFTSRRQDDYNIPGRYSTPRMPPNTQQQPVFGRPGEFAGDIARSGYPGNIPSPSPVVDGTMLPRPGHYNPPPVLRGGASDSQEVPHRNSLSVSKPDYEPAQPNGNDFSPLASFVHGQFDIRDFSDYSVQLSHLSYLFPPFSLACHGLVLARSPKLRSLMAMQNGGPSQTYPKTLQIQVSDRFLNSDTAITKALMRLYGEPLPDDSFMSTVTLSSSQDNHNTAVRNDPINFALAYAAAGHFLQHPDIITRGLDLAARALQWTNIEKALAFALEGGLGPNWNHGETTAIEDLASTSSVDDGPAKLDSPTAAPQYGIYSDRLLRHVLQFIINEWPDDFKFAATAPQLYEVPRVPAVAEPKHGQTGSRLSHIRFGEMTLEDHESSADPMSAKLSSILMSLPFPLLKHVMEHGGLAEKMGAAKLAQVARAVVEERENRRRRGTNARGSNQIAESASEERLWHNVRWVESVEQDEQGPTGIKLSRSRVGVETPPSTGSGKS